MAYYFMLGLLQSTRFSLSKKHLPTLEMGGWSRQKVQHMTDQNMESIESSTNIGSREKRAGQTNGTKSCCTEQVMSMLQPLMLNLTEIQLCSSVTGAMCWNQERGETYHRRSTKSAYLDQGGSHVENSIPYICIHVL